MYATFRVKELCELDGQYALILKKKKYIISFKNNSWFISIFFRYGKKVPDVVTRDVCRSSVEITLERGSDRSVEPIDLKIVLNMGN